MGLTVKPCPMPEFTTDLMKKNQSTGWTTNWFIGSSNRFNHRVGCGNARKTGRNTCLGINWSTRRSNLRSGRFRKWTRRATRCGVNQWSFSLRNCFLGRSNLSGMSASHFHYPWSAYSIGRNWRAFRFRWTFYIGRNLSSSFSYRRFSSAAFRAIGRQYSLSSHGSRFLYMSNGLALSISALRPVNCQSGGPCIALGYCSRRGNS